MLRVHGRYIFNYFSAGTDFYTSGSVDVRFCRLKTVPALKGFMCTGDGIAMAVLIYQNK